MSIAPKLLQRIEVHQSDVTCLDFYGHSMLVTGSRYFFRVLASSVPLSHTHVIYF
jgi:hypothetical protein